MGRFWANAMATMALACALQVAGCDKGAGCQLQPEGAPCAKDADCATLLVCGADDRCHSLKWVRAHPGARGVSPRSATPLSATPAQVGNARASAVASTGGPLANGVTPTVAADRANDLASAPPPAADDAPAAAPNNEPAAEPADAPVAPAGTSGETGAKADPLLAMAAKEALQKQALFKDPCAKLAACKRAGLCAGQKGQCKAGADEHCAASEGCRTEGLCNVRAGRCIALGMAACSSSVACEKEGRCDERDGKCVKPSEP